MRFTSFRIFTRAAVLLATLVAACTESVPPSNFTLSADASAVTLPQGQSTSIALEVARNNFDATISLTATGLPEGVTAVFAPPSMGPTISSAVVTLTSEPAAGTGEGTVTITATSEGTESAVQVTVTIQVSGSYSLTADPDPVTVVRNDQSAVTIGIVRTGGFSQAVALAASGLPSGVTATFSGLPATGGGATLSLAASGSAVFGDATVTITGTSAGVPDQTTTLTVTVSDAPATEAFSLDFCADGIPTWVAFRNQGGAWTHVTADASGTFTYDVTPKFSLAYVFAPGAGSEIHIVSATREEVAWVNDAACVEPSADYPGVSFQGVGDSQMGSSSLGAIGTRQQGASDDGSTEVVDLVASRSPFPGPNANSVVIRRAIPVPGGSAQVVDFESAEAFAPTPFSLTIAGAPALPATTLVQSAFEARSPGTTQATFHILWVGDYTDATMAAKAVPAGNMVDGDTHYLFAGTTNTVPKSRGASLTFGEPADVTLLLGGDIATPELSQVASAPYARHRVTVSAGEYTGAVRVMLGQTQRFHTMWVSSGFLGSTPSVWDVTMPDFTGVDGWDPTWGMQAGSTTNKGATIYSAGVLPFTELAPRAAKGIQLRWAMYLPSPFP